MLLGKIVGKVTTREFSFNVDKEVRKFDYVQVYHPQADYVLCQIVEIERDENRTLAKCVIIGTSDEHGKTMQIRSPFEAGAEVLKAEEDFIQRAVGLQDVQGAYLGKLEGTNIDMKIDLSTLLTKHVAVLAKSGAGKSYAVGVLLEEIAEKKVPVLVIDPHGEYSSMKHKNSNAGEQDLLKRFGVMPKGFNVEEFGDMQTTGARPLQLSNALNAQEIVHLFPGKLSSTQLGILYSSLKNLNHITFNSLLAELEREESNAKWHIINVLEYLNRLELFTDTPTAYNELLSSGQVSIINLKGITPEIQEIITYKICKDLFEKRKVEEVPPFFLVVEEAHNFCPERSFGESKSSAIIRTIASEGRKFGLGLCVISQRPARVDKSVLSQCTTQIILKVTNPNDLKAVSNSVEGLTSNVEKEIQNLNIGSALVCGVSDIPLFVTIRPRKSMHGGQAVDMLSKSAEDQDFFDKIDSFQEEEVLPVIMPDVSRKDMVLLHKEPGGAEPVITTTLIPAYQFVCEEKENRYNLIVDMVEGMIIVDKNEIRGKMLPRIHDLTQKQLTVLQAAFQLKTFCAEDMIRKIGANLDIADELDYLVNEGYLLKEEKRYMLTNSYVLSRLSTHANYDKITYSKIGYDEKQEGKVNLDDMKKRLSRFTSVLDQRSCWLVKYGIADT